MKTPDTEMERNVLLIMLGMLVIGSFIAFAGNFESTTTSNKDKPLWMNLTSNETHLIFDYDANTVPGFKSLLLQASWTDPYTDNMRELYSVKSNLTRASISFPKFVTLGSPPLIIGAVVETDTNMGVLQTRKYIWRVVQEPLTLGLDSPVIDYIR